MEDKDMRLGFGPMSKEIIDAINAYTITREQPLMIIASRNQVDHNGGYVMNTQELSEAVKGNQYIWLCRDHCGPYFLDNERGLSDRDAIDATKRTIAKDIEQNFDLIHIDTSRIANGYVVAEELFKFCLDLNPNIKFEFGTEENVGVAAGVKKYKDDVTFAKQFPNMQFVVAQTGSLVRGDEQAGTFDSDIVKELVEYAKEAGVRLKEHNADYLTPAQIQLRKAAGVHALNIAPQLGVIQTKAIREAVTEGNLRNWGQFAGLVIQGNKWKKWDFDNSFAEKICIAGHYHYNSPEYKTLAFDLDPWWKFQLSLKLYSLFDSYIDNM